MVPFGILRGSSEMSEFMGKARILHLVEKVLPLSNQIRDIDMHAESDAIRFTWRGSRLRVTTALGVESVKDGCLSSCNLSTVIEKMLADNSVLFDLRLVEIDQRLTNKVQITIDLDVWNKNKEILACAKESVQELLFAHFDNLEEITKKDACIEKMYRDEISDIDSMLEHYESN